MDAEELVAAVSRALAGLFDRPDDSKEPELQLVHALEQVLQVVSTKAATVLTLFSHAYTSSPAALGLPTSRPASRATEGSARHGAQWRQWQPHSLGPSDP
jgi:hypothetical protein